MERIQLLRITSREEYYWLTKKHMTWTKVSISQNTDNPNIGEIVAIWNEGLADQFTFSKRGDAGQIPAFVTAAKAAQLANTTKQNGVDITKAAILTALNS